MVLYTVVAADEVMLDLKLPIPELKMQNGRIFEGKNGKNGFEISRLISTDPADYLNPGFEPGSLLI